MRLYHGGEEAVTVPEVISPAGRRPLDFGSGFYATTSLEQARRWVGTRIRQKVYRTGVVSVYEFDEAGMASPELKVKLFRNPDGEWFDFVMSNRHADGFAHDFDIVGGPVANDNVYETLTLFEDGILTKDEAVLRLKAYKLTDQYLFHTRAALRLLRFAGVEAAV